MGTIKVELPAPFDYSSLPRMKPGEVHVAVDRNPSPSERYDIWTDGACRRNPGPMGVGCVILHRGSEVQISEARGHGTNNVAELQAVERALEEIPASRDVHLVIHTDSQNTIGWLAKNWSVRKAHLVLLIYDLKNHLRQYGKVEFVKCKGHVDDRMNNLADKLATEGSWLPYEEAEEGP